MDKLDAYAPPRATVRDVAGGSGLMSDAVILSLRKTRPWVMLLAVLGFISSAILAIVSVPMLMGARMMTEVQGVDGSAVLGAGFVIGMGLLYLVFALLLFMASFYLLRYASAIRRAVIGLALSDLEMALEQQARFWKLIGVLSIITILLIVLMMVVGVGGAIYFGSQT